MKKLISLMLSWMATQAAAVSVGDPWTAGSLRQIQAGTLTPEQMLGKVTLINFWATWCEACKVELVEMERLLAPQLARQDFNLVFLSLDKDPSKAVTWFKTELAQGDKMLPRLYSDPKFEIADKLAVDSFPMTLVINRAGKVSYVQKGFTPGQGLTEKLVAHVQQELQR